ncbi:hypothetical protein EDB19DRAFT_1691767, partial [Suillus lakei]
MTHLVVANLVVANLVVTTAFEPVRATAVEDQAVPFHARNMLIYRMCARWSALSCACYAPLFFFLGEGHEERA